MLDDDWILQLESKGNATNVELWRGMSGAPVFLENTNTLVAIITETPRQDKEGEAVHKDRLYAVSVPYLLKNCPDFKQKTHFKNDITVFLENAVNLLKHEALITLFTQHDQAIPNNALALCRYLSHQPLRDFLCLIATLQEQNEQKKSALGELVCTLLPHLFDDEKAIEIRMGIGEHSCPLVAVSYASPVSVEMLMAKVDYRQAQIAKFTQKEFIASYRLPLPPDSADDEKAMERDIKADVYHQFAGDQQRLVAENITRRLYNREVEQGVLGDFESDEQERVDFVKDALADRVEDKESSYYFIVDADAMGGEVQVNQFANALKNIYPHCAIIYCEANRQIKRQELSEYRKLRSVLTPYLTMDEPL